MVNRRAVLQGTLGGLLASSSLARVACAASGAASDGVRLGGKLALLSGGKDNVLALATGGAGVLLVDSGSPGST
ncbi:MAG: hypothetical protein ACREU3_15570, partial [Steroidobacteraceae bacterium]